MAKRRPFIFDGLGVSNGVAIGTAYVFEEDSHEHEAREIPPEEVEAEIARFEKAVDQATEEIQELGRAVALHLDSQQAAIFDAHVTLLSDPLLVDRTKNRIRDECKTAEHLFWAITREISEQLSSLGDAYFSERSHDLFDVSRRVIKFLNRLKNPDGLVVPPGSIVVANDLGPSETAQFVRDKVAAFCTNTGGPTSHTAIIAKALGLPAVVGLDFITHYVRNGDTLVIDGTEGAVILNPTEDQLAYYREQAANYERRTREIARISSLPAVTLDGVNITLEANIEFPHEIDAVRASGACGIGLYRTEYLFIDRETLPSEDEQEVAYRTVFDAFPEQPVVVRTLDVGGDKMARSLPVGSEGNPFLGMRALRLCLAFPELFRSQLRPIIKAAAGRELRLMLPMISGIEEVTQAKTYIHEVIDQIDRSGEGLPSRVLIGGMIEIPSAALEAETLATELDFFSIGTNDLTQYTLAVDRVNKAVGHLYQETHPAVLRLIEQVLRVGRERNLPVTVCGEMAGLPHLALLLVGLGCRCLSMSPPLVGSVKKAIRGVEMTKLESIAQEVRQLKTSKEIRQTLLRHLENVLVPHDAAPIYQGEPT